MRAIGRRSDPCGAVVSGEDIRHCKLARAVDIFMRLLRRSSKRTQQQAGRTVEQFAAFDASGGCSSRAVSGVRRLACGRALL